MKKPLLRGYLHQETFFIILGACALLIFKGTSDEAFLASLVYSFGLLFMLGTSTIYHRITWAPKKRAILKRIDHSAIFILIASTATPVAMFALPPEEGKEFLILVWSAAIVGVFQSIFWVTAPKYITAIFYIFVGCLAVPYSSSINAAIGSAKLSLIILGGFFYIVGALFYAFKKPNLYPGVFGYHELFHLFTVFGIFFHFVLVYQLIK